jgi:hypothetical protein
MTVPSCGNCGEDQVAQTVAESVDELEPGPEDAKTRTLELELADEIEDYLLWMDELRLD